MATNNPIDAIKEKYKQDREQVEKAQKELTDLLNRIADTKDGFKLFTFLANQTLLFIPQISYKKTIEDSGMSVDYFTGQRDLGLTVFNLLTPENYSKIYTELKKPKQRK